MIKYGLILWLVLVGLCEASPTHGERDGVEYVVSPNGTAYFKTLRTEWDVTCAKGMCRAGAGDVSLILDQSGWYLESSSAKEVFHWKARVRRALPVDQVLNQLELRTLEAGGALETSDQAEHVDLNGLHVVTLYMRTITGVLAPAPIPTPLSHHQIADDHLKTASAKLVPFTKPQIEFAIRAQTSSLMTD